MDICKSCSTCAQRDATSRNSDCIKCFAGSHWKPSFAFAEVGGCAPSVVSDVESEIETATTEEKMSEIGSELIAHHVKELSISLGFLRKLESIQIKNLKNEPIEIEVPLDVWEKLKSDSVTVRDDVTEFRLYKKVSDSVFIYTIAYATPPWERKAAA